MGAFAMVRTCRYAVPNPMVKGKRDRGIRPGSEFLTQVIKDQEDRLAASRSFHDKEESDSDFDDVLCAIEALKGDVKEEFDKSGPVYFTGNARKVAQAALRWLEQVEENQDKSSGSEDKQSEAIPHGPMRKPKKKRHEDECRTRTLQHHPTINRTEGNMTSTRVTGEKEETHVSTKLAWEAMHARGFCKGVSYDRLVKLLQKHYTWTWKGTVVFDTWTWEGTV